MRRKLFLFTTFCFLRLCFVAQPDLESPEDVPGNIIASDTAGCVPLIVSFESDAFTAVAWNWDFGNGRTSSIQNPVEIFDTSGNYTITLEVTYAGGETDQISITDLINVYPKPIADFTLNDSTYCAGGSSVSIQNNSIGADQNVWDFGDNFISTSASPDHVYMDAGNYTINLIVSSEHGCASDYSISGVEVHEAQNSNVNLLTAALSCDTSFVFEFQASNQSLSDYSWDFGDGSTGSGVEVEYSYNNYDEFEVSLITEDLHGCKDTSRLNNTVRLFNPHGEIAVSSQFSCTGTPIEFEILGDQEPVSVKWNFGDNTIYSGIDVEHTYQNEGVYSISAIVEHIGGCIDTLYKNEFINIDHINASFFQMSDSIVCLGEPIILWETISNYDSLYWDLGDNNMSNQDSLSHIYSSPGTYEISLHITSGNCQKVINQNVHISSPNVSFTSNRLTTCIPVEVNFTNNTETGGLYEWDFGNGASSTEENPLITYHSPGNYNVTLWVQDSLGCRDSLLIEDAVKIVDNTPNGIEPVLFEGCAPMSISMLNFSFGGENLNWNFGEGTQNSSPTPNHSYQNEGTYNISMSATDTSGCLMQIDTFAVAVVHKNVVDSLSLDINCETGLLKAEAHCPDCTEWNWNFGDDTISNGNNAVHLYENFGLYYVSLVGFSEEGCAANSVYYVDLINCTSGFSMDEPSLILDPLTGELEGWGFDPEPPLEPTIAALEYCAPYSVHFYNPRPNSNTWLWDFGDGNTDTAQYPIHTYSEVGEYSLTLNYDSMGVMKTMYFHNFINVLGYESTIVVEEFNSCDSLYLDVAADNSQLMNYQWNVDGENSGVTSYNNNVILPGDGNLHVVTLTTTDENFCNYSTSLALLSPNFHPWVDFPDVNCLGDTLYLEHYLNGFTEVTWHFGDGTTNSSLLPYHIYSDTGNYTLEVELTNSSNCSQHYELGNVNVVGANSSFELASLEEICVGDTIIVNSIEDTYANYEWGAGSANILSSNENLTAIATSPGPQYVSLTVDVEGCTSKSEDSSIVMVNQADVNFTFEQNNSCLPITIQFVDQSNDVMNYQWNFGDGNTNTSESPNHTFTTKPSEDVSLTITDIHGCVASVSKPNIELFHTEFTIDTTFGCAPVIIGFTDNTEHSIRWEWNFGDGESSSEENPIHQYNERGVYSISLITESIDGCKDSLMLDSLVTIDKLKAEYTVSYGSGCAPQPVFFTDISDNAETWNWNFGNGNISSSQNPIQVYYIGGDYFPELVIESPLGCTDTAILDQSIKIQGPASIFSVVDSVFCIGDSAEFLNTSLNAESYLWLFGDGESSELDSPYHYYASPGSYAVSLISGDVAGCQNVAVVDSAVFVAEKPVANYSISDTLGCDSLEVNFLSTSNDNAFWYINDSLLSEEADFTKLFSNGSFHVSLAVENEYGCRDVSDTAEVVVHASPQPTILIEESICENVESVALSSTYSGGAWFIDGSMSEDSLNWDIQSAGAGIHEIIQKIEGVCPGFDTLMVTVDSLIYVKGASDFQLCEYSDEFHLKDLEPLGYWIGNGITDSISGSFLPSNIQIGTNLFENILVNGACENRDSVLVTINPKPNSSFSMDNVIFCQGDSLRIAPVHQSDDATYSWLFSSSSDTIEYDGMYPAVDLLSDKWNIMLNVNEYGCEGSDSVTKFNVFDTIAPSASTIIRSTVLNDELVYTEWTTPEFGQENVLNYQIWRANDAEKYELIVEVDSTVNIYEDHNVDVMNEKYFYVIKPTNVCNVQTTKSNISSSILLKKGEETNENVVLRWNQYEKWEEGVDYYEVFRKNENGEWELLKRVSKDENYILLGK